MANLVFFADKPRKEASAAGKTADPNPPESDGEQGPPAFQGGHLVVEPISLTPSTPACNLMNPKYRDEKVQNMQPMQTQTRDGLG